MPVDIKTSGVFTLLLSGALAFILFLTSCGKKQEAPAAADTQADAVAAPELPLNVPRELEEYKDPKGAFVVNLPKGYTFSDKTVGDKLKYIFSYGSVVNLIITQTAAPAEWDSAAEMAKKQDEIRTGRAGFPPAMALLGREILSFGGLKGFQTVLAGSLAGQETQMNAYYLAAGEKLFTIIVTRKEPSASVLYAQVKTCITNSFRLASFNPASTVDSKPAVQVAVTNVAAPVAVTNVVAPVVPATNAAAKPVTVAPKQKPTAVVEPVRPVDSRTEAEWGAAKAMLKFTGSMKMGGQQVAMVNDKILRKGDKISVMFRDKEYTFIVTTILPNSVEYKRELK